jgi:TolB-like protein
MKNSIISLSLCLSVSLGLGGCASLPSVLTPWAQQTTQANTESTSKAQSSESAKLDTIAPETTASPLATTTAITPLSDSVILPMYKTQFTYTQVDAYVNRLFMALQHNAPTSLARQSIAVVNFVKFDQALTNVTLLGQHITEYLMQEGQRVGYHIIEHKVTNRIEQSSKGDTVFDYYLSHQAQDFDAVLTGTIIPSPSGLKVHARIVDMQNQSILTSANVLIPRFIVDQLPQIEPNSPIDGSHLGSKSD